MWTRRNVSKTVVIGKSIHGFLHHLASMFLRAILNLPLIFFGAKTEKMKWLFNLLLSVRRWVIKPHLS